MKMKNKLHYLMMAVIVAVVSAVTWSCNKDDDPSLAALRDDKLQFLTDSLRISDSLRLTNNAGVVNYAITVVDGSTSSIFANPNNLDGGGRVSKTQSAVSGAVVTISQYGKRQTDTTDASGIVVFNGFFRSAVNITIEKTDFTKVSYISGVNIQDSTRTGTISFVGNLIPIFPLTGPNTATISGRATIQTDLTNKTRELVPDGTVVTASIDASNGSSFAKRFLTTDINDALFKSACGCKFVYVGNILQASYQAGSRGTVTGGNYSITVPAAIDSLPLALDYSDVAADQTLFETTTAFGQRTIVQRAIFNTDPAENLPSSSSVQVSFASYDVAAAATAMISANLGTLDRIVLTAGGTGYTAPPVVEIVGGGGTGATATATVANGAVTGVTITAAGSGYTTQPAVNFIAGKDADASTVLVSNGTITGVSLTNSGSGYTAAPTVTFGAPGGTGTTATGTANIDAAGRVTSVTITGAGSGYTGNTTVTFSASPTGADAIGVGIYSGNSIGAITIIDGGSDYTSVPTVIFSAPERANGVTATGTAVIDPTTLEVTGINVTNAGSGYTAAPTITISSASGAGATAFLAGGAVTSVNVTNQGLNYVGTPTVVITPAAADATTAGGATATATVVGGKVVSISVTNGGVGYSLPPIITLESGDNANAYATITDGAITGITVTDGGRFYSGAPRVIISSTNGSGATATATVSNGAIDGVTVTAGGSGYLEGNTPTAKEEFSATKGSKINTKPGLTYINDIHYGTGVRRPN